MPLAFLSPEIVRKDLVRTQPAELTRSVMTRIDLPTTWTDQMSLADATISNHRSSKTGTNLRSANPTTNRPNPCFALHGFDCSLQSNRAPFRGSVGTEELNVCFTHGPPTARVGKLVVEVQAV